MEKVTGLYHLFTFHYLLQINEHCPLILDRIEQKIEWGRGYIVRQFVRIIKLIAESTLNFNTAYYLLSMSRIKILKKGEDLIKKNAKIVSRGDFSLSLFTHLWTKIHEKEGGWEAIQLASTAIKQSTIFF